MKVQEPSKAMRRSMRLLLVSVIAINEIYYFYWHKRIIIRCIGQLSKKKTTNNCFEIKRNTKRNKQNFFLLIINDDWRHTLQSNLRIKISLSNPIRGNKYAKTHTFILTETRKIVKKLQIWIIWLSCLNNFIFWSFHLLNCNSTILCKASVNNWWLCNVCTEKFYIFWLTFNNLLNSRMK